MLEILSTEHLSILNTKDGPKEVQFRQCDIQQIKILMGLSQF